jgi:hypothetical protein
MAQADLSNSMALFKPFIEKAMKAAGKPDGKTKRKAEIKTKLKLGVKVRKG